MLHVYTCTLYYQFLHLYTFALYHILYANEGTTLYMYTVLIAKTLQSPLLGFSLACYMYMPCSGSLFSAPPPSPPTHSLSLFPSYTESTEKPDLQSLLNLPSHGGRVIKVIESSAARYYNIGIILLNDRHGDRVSAIERSLNRQVMDIMREVYREWLAEDINCSWTTLTDCFRQCDLNNLAYSIEQHFGLPSPPSHSLQHIPVPQSQPTPVPTPQHIPEGEHNFKTSGYTCDISSKI